MQSINYLNFIGTHNCKVTSNFCMDFGNGVLLTAELPYVFFFCMDLGNGVLVNAKKFC